MRFDLLLWNSEFVFNAFDKDDIFNILMMLGFLRTHYQFHKTYLIIVTVNKWGFPIEYDRQRITFET